jgi:hypothetical protein
VVIVDNKIYVVAGYSNKWEGSTTNLTILNLDTKQYSSNDTFCEPRYFCKAAVINRKIYLPGGEREGAKPSSFVYIYDIDTNTWIVGSDMHTRRSCYAVAAMREFLYVFGGTSDFETHVRRILTEQTNINRNFDVKD